MIQMYSHQLSEQVDILPENGYILLIRETSDFQRFVIDFKMTVLQTSIMNFSRTLKKLLI